MIRKKKWIQGFQGTGHLNMAKGADWDKSEAKGSQVRINWEDESIFKVKS